MTRRLLQLYAGLVLYGLSMALQVRATLGLGPWDVFHEGVAEHTGLSFGTVVIVTSVAVLLLWIPLRQKPGIGTVSNVFVVGLAADAGLALIPEGGPLGVRLTMLTAAVGAQRRRGRRLPRREARAGRARRADDRARAPHRRLGRRRSAPASS